MAYEAFTAEVDRIVKSPYPTQLKQLHEIACLKCSDADVSRWAHARACQIDSLAMNLLEARQQWPYVLEIITKVSGQPKIRDAFFQQESSLLFEIVSRAVDGADESWKFSAAAIAMLSHPLPDRTTLPASSQSLFLGVLDHAAQEPAARSIRPAYLLLKGAMAPLIGLLSNDLLRRLETQLLNIIRSTKTAEGNCFSLYTLATMKCLISANEDSTFHSSASFCNTQELLASTPGSPRWEPKALQQFFSGDKAHKTLQLIVLRVLWACNANGDESIDEMLETLSLANELVTSVPMALRQSWCNENRMIARKLQEKVVQPDLADSIRLHAGLFLCKLYGSESVPSSIVETLSKSISDPFRFASTFGGSSASAMSALAQHVAPAAIFDFVSALPNVLYQADSTTFVASSEAIASSIDSLAETLFHDPPAAENTFRSIQCVAADIRRLKGVIEPASLAYAEHDGICAVALAQARRRVVRSICRLGLMSTMFAHHADSGIDPGLAVLLIEIHALSATPSEECNHAGRSRNNGKPALNLSCLDQAHDVSTGDWRDALSSHLQQKAKTDQDVLAKLFSNACRELEARCQDVETPLRQEREKVGSLQDQYDALSRAYAELEESKAQSDLRVDSLKAETHRCVEVIDSARAENERLVNSIGTLEEHLRSSNAEAELRLAARRRSRDKAELEYATASARNEEELEDLRSRLAAADDRLRCNEKQTLDIEQSLAQRHLELATARSETETLRESVTGHKRSIDVLESDKGGALIRCTFLSSEIDDLKDQLHSAGAREEAISVVLRQAQQEFVFKVQALEKAHHHQIEDIERTRLEVLECHERETANLRQSLEETSAQLAQREKRITEATRKIDQLKTAYVEKDREIADLNAIRNNMMAAMGVAAAAVRPSTRQARRKGEVLMDTDPCVETRSPSAGVDTPDGPATTEPKHPHALSDSQLVVTPKRARSRKSIKATLPATRYSRDLRRSASEILPGINSTQRQPLMPAHGNRSPPKGTRKSTLQATWNDKILEEEFDGSAFDESEVLTDTPGVHTWRASELPDDTTTTHVE